MAHHVANEDPYTGIREFLDSEKVAAHTHRGLVKVVEAYGRFPAHSKQHPVNWLPYNSLSPLFSIKLSLKFEAREPQHQTQLCGA